MERSDLDIVRFNTLRNCITYGYVRVPEKNKKLYSIVFELLKFFVQFAIVKWQLMLTAGLINNSKVIDVSIGLPFEHPNFIRKPNSVRFGFGPMSLTLRSE